MPAEVLEQRQLLSDDPITELNTKFTLAIGTSNAQIEDFFNGGSTGAAGGLNGALGGAAAKFNQQPLNGSEIDDSAITDVSTQIGTVESRVSSAINAIKGAKPVIAFPETFNIGVQFNYPMMMMPGMQMGSRGYSYVNILTGDFYGSSNYLVEVPSTTPGVMSSRLSMQGTISRSNGVQTWDIKSDWTEQLPGGSRAYHVEFANPSWSTGNVLKFSGSQTIGTTTTSAYAEMQNGVVIYSSYGGSTNLGDITASFSKNHMYQTDRLFGQIEYLSGNTKASAQVTQITSPSKNITAVASMISLLNNQADLERYLQVGAGNVTGTANGQPINDSFGIIRFKMPVKRLFPWSPKYIDASSSWHNGDIFGGPPVLNSSPQNMDLDTLFISHENYKSSIFGQVNQVVIGLDVTPW